MSLLTTDRRPLGTTCLYIHTKFARMFDIQQYVFIYKTCMALQNGRSCLHEASSCGHRQLVQYLCELGKDELLGLCDSQGLSALACAQDDAIVEYLLSSDALMRD